MNYRDKYSRTAEWWRQDKPDYIFNRHWMEVAAAADKDHIIELPPRQSVEDSGLPYDNYGKVGLVLWHDEDGQTILPVGLIGHKEGKTVFCYHPEYAADPAAPAISRSLPKTKLRHIWPPEGLTEAQATSVGNRTILPFFDNLVSEGVLGLAQENACTQLKNIFKKYKGDKPRDPLKSVDEFVTHDNAKHRFGRLLTFGRGFHGAVSVVDIAMPDQVAGFEQDLSLQSMGTVGGMNPKSLGIKTPDGYEPAPRNADSGYILKFHNPSLMGPDLTQNEYLSFIASKVLLPDDTFPEFDLAMVPNPRKKKSDGQDEPDKVKAFVVRRFDRGKGRLHFEEATQLMGIPASEKTERSYQELGTLTHAIMGEEGAKQVFKRILAQLVLGNTDGHLKNIGFRAKKDGGWELTENYDLVAASHYSYKEKNPYIESSREKLRSYKTLPLRYNNKSPARALGEMLPKELFLLAGNLGLSYDDAKTILYEMKARIPAAIKAIEETRHDLVEPQYQQQFADSIRRQFACQYGSLDRYCQFKEQGRGSGGFSLG